MPHEAQLFVRDTQGSLVAVLANVEGELLTNAGSGGTSGVVQTSNPTPTAAGESATAMYDKVGRAVTVPYHIRDLVSTAYLQLDTNTTSPFIAATAGEYHDIMELTFANSSTVATAVTLLHDGTIEKTFMLPASNTLDMQYTIPLKEGESNAVWALAYIKTTVSGSDLISDVSNTTVYVSGKFIRNV